MTPNMDLYGHYGGALGGFLMALLMADMKPEHRPPWYNTAKKMATVTLGAVLGIGFSKLFFFTPINPLPDCAFPSLNYLMAEASLTKAASMASIVVPWGLASLGMAIAERDFLAKTTHSSGGAMKTLPSSAAEERTTFENFTDLAGSWFSYSQV